jgi:tellurite resistance protein TerC
VVLIFVGTKMLLDAWKIKIPIAVALGVVAAVLVISVVASLLWPKRVTASASEPAPPHL